MRREHLWFGIALAWAVDAALALLHHRVGAGLLAAAFACCFLAVGFLVRRRAQRTRR